VERAIRAHRQRTDIRFTHNAIDGASIEEAYVYRLVPPAMTRSERRALARPNCPFAQQT